MIKPSLLFFSALIMSSFSLNSYATNCSDPNNPNCTPAQYYDAVIANNIANKKQQQLQQSQQNTPRLPALQFPSPYQKYAPANQGHQDDTSSSPSITNNTSQNNNNGFPATDVKAVLAPANQGQQENSPPDVTNSGRVGPVKYKYNFQ